MSRRKTNFQVDDLINDYVNNGMGVEPICAKYHIGKVKVRQILKVNGIEMKKVGGQALNEDFLVKDFRTKKYEKHEGYHYEAVDKKTQFKTKDYMNKAGVLTTYIEETYGISTPTLYDRRLYYMRTGNYWWEQWFKIIEVENPKVKKCPYCNWTTVDIDNRSGAFEVHLNTTHGITKEKYLEEFPNDKEYFRLANPTLDLQFETDENKFVICKICGRKLTRITDRHLKRHGLTKLEYMEKYGLSGTTCNELHDKLRKHASEMNMHLTADFSSQQKREIREYVNALGFECFSDRRILKGKELDVFIPSKNIAIEYNGNMWHSEKYGKGKNYHLDKLEVCNSQGVKLIQIFEDECAEHKDIVFSKIKHILGCDSGEKIQGRKCVVEKISVRTAEEFLNANHIQGFANATVFLGAKIKSDNRLIAVMSFLNEGYGNWNLTRFASLNGMRCQGIGGKLFTYFVKKYNPLVVKSFADRRWTLDKDNNIYTKLGFRLEETLRPEYRYYNPKVDRFKRFHKFAFRKERLNKKYGLPLTMTELEMATKLGYTRIWDCGLFKYVWERGEN